MVLPDSEGRSRKSESRKSEVGIYSCHSGFGGWKSEVGKSEVGFFSCHSGFGGQKSEVGISLSSR
eukprot:9171276-Karenia_brevis.AAC.1